MKTNQEITARQRTFLKKVTNNEQTLIVSLLVRVTEKIKRHK